VYEVQEEDLGALPEPERDPAAPRTPDEEAADARLEQAFRLVRAMSGKAEARALSNPHPNPFLALYPARRSGQLV
jgi:hypothetical protein